MQKLLFSMPRTNPDIRVEAVGQDPLSLDYTGFSVLDSTSNEVLGRFHADDIFQQRNFMVALGGSGPGLFTQSPDDTLEENRVSETEGSLHAECDELLMRKLAYDSRLNLIDIDLPSYEWTMKNLPGEFYFSQGIGKDIDLPGPELPIYNSVTNSGITFNSSHRRTVNDTFLPPHGAAVYPPISIGRGKEVGLEPHQQAIWNTENNFYYFLDHQTKISFIDDPRPVNDVVKTVTKRNVVPVNNNSTAKSSSLLPMVCKESSTVNLAAERAMRKPHGLVIKGLGRNGEAGVDGENGLDGPGGTNGALGIGGDGKLGEDGTSGERGRSGSTGEDGSNGAKYVMHLSGDASELHLIINDGYRTIAKLGGDRNEEVVLVNCHGGDGGDGGHGGQGGAGGSGGDGGNGGKNGDGGHGGDGGYGGAGGDGGDGGSAGSGGVCVITASDPRLLMLVETDCRAGKKGKAGEGGDGGKGGTAGYGGEGGSWEEESDVRGAVQTVRGMKGKPGSTGTDGTSGKTGQDGNSGSDGGLLWVVQLLSGEVLHQSGSRYEATVSSMKISPALCDNTYEPNQLFTVSEVVVSNTGGLPLPKGAKLLFPTTKTICFESTVFELPELAPNESFSVPVEFKGRIIDQATPNLPGPLSAEASFAPRIELLGRPFEVSLEKTLQVAYPIRFSFALSRKNIGRGEVSVFEVGVENVSQVTYGSTENSNGSVSVCLRLSSSLVPLGVYQNKMEQSPFRVTHDPCVPNSMWITIKKIEPGEVLTVPISIMMDSEAKLCDSCFWQSDLHYKGKLVEYKQQGIRVTPAYSPSNSPSNLGDVLMITSELISATEFTLWQKIFDILNLNVDYWDASNDRKDLHTSERTELEGSNSVEVPSSQSSSFNRISSSNLFTSSLPPFYKMYSAKTIIYPHCNLDKIPPGQIVSHLESSKALDSNMLLFLSSSAPHSLEDYHYDNKGHAQILRHLCNPQDRMKLPEDIHSGHHLVAPGTLVPADVAIKKSEKKILKKLEKDHPAQALAVFSHNTKIVQKSLCKYTYGLIDVRKCPIPRSSNFQCVDGAGGSLTSMGADDPLLTTESREFPLASRFGQVFLTVLASVPLKCKLRILKSSDDKSSQGFVKCHLPNGMFLKKQQLAAIVIAHEVADEVLGCCGSISRMKQVREDLQSNKCVYTLNGMANTVNQMLSLIQREVSERAGRFQFPAVLEAANEIQEMCKSLSITDLSQNGILCTDKSGSLLSWPGALSSSDIAGSKTQTHRIMSLSRQTSNTVTVDVGSSESLPPLRVLQDSIHVLRSHQLRVEESCYNVSR